MGTSSRWGKSLTLTTGRRIYPPYSLWRRREGRPRVWKPWRRRRLAQKHRGWLQPRAAGVVTPDALALNDPRSAQQISKSMAPLKHLLKNTIRSVCSRCISTPAWCFVWRRRKMSAIDPTSFCSPHCLSRGFKLGGQRSWWARPRTGRPSFSLKVQISQDGANALRRLCTHNVPARIEIKITCDQGARRADGAGRGTPMAPHRRGTGFPCETYCNLHHFALFLVHCQSSATKITYQHSLIINLLRSLRIYFSFHSTAKLISKSFFWVPNRIQLGKIHQYSSIESSSALPYRLLEMEKARCLSWWVHSTGLLSRPESVKRARNLCCRRSHTRRQAARPTSSDSQSSDWAAPFFARAVSDMLARLRAAACGLQTFAPKPHAGERARTQKHSGSADCG